MVKAADAIALFSAYAALIAVATVYQTLALQTLGHDVEAVDENMRSYPDSDEYRTMRRGKVLWILAKALVVAGSTTVLCFALAGWSDDIARVMNPADNIPAWTVLNATLALRLMFAFTVAVFLASLLGHGSVKEAVLGRR